MALINKLESTASVTFNGSTINSNTVETLLLLAPTLVKAVDKTTASVGDVLNYTVKVTNVGLTEIANLPFADTIPSGGTYVEDSFQVNGVPARPTVTGSDITYTLPSLAALGRATITFQVNVTGGETSLDLLP